MKKENSYIFYLYILIYGLLLCFVRFSGISNSAYMPLFSLFENPNYYPNDLYVQGSIVSSGSYLYPLLKVFGALPSNTYFIFFLYIIASLAHIYFIFKIAEELFPELRKYNIGLVSLLMFLYDYPIFTAHSQLVSQHTFSQTMVAMPILAASLYYYFKDRLALSIFLVSVLAIPLHFKSAWFILGSIFLFVILSHKRISLRAKFLIMFFIFIGAFAMFLYRANSVSSDRSFYKLRELCDAIIRRGLEEDVILMNTPAYFAKFFLIFFGGLICVRFVKNALKRSKLACFYGFTVFVFVFGAVYSAYFYKIFPVPEIAILGFPRAMAYPIIISMLLICGALVSLIVSTNQKKWIQNLCIVGLFALAFFPNFKISILIYLIIIVITYFLVYRNNKIVSMMKIAPLSAWLYVVVIAFLLVRAGAVTIKSYKNKSPFFPLVVFGLERNSYDCQMWAKKNTTIDSVFIFYRGDGHDLIFDNTFRRFSCRGMLFGDYNNFYLNYDLYQESLKRERFVNALAAAIVSGNNEDLNKLISASQWRIDYLVVPRHYILNYPKVYANEMYSCYYIKR